MFENLTFRQGVLRSSNTGSVMGFGPFCFVEVVGSGMVCWSATSLERFDTGDVNGFTDIEERRACTSA